MSSSSTSRTDEVQNSQTDRSAAEQLDRTLDEWRARIDELKVQVDLATLNVREDLRTRLEVAENVYLAVRSRLSDVRHDTGTDVSTLRQSVDQLLRDLRRAYDDAVAVVNRGPQA